MDGAGTAPDVDPGVNPDIVPAWARRYCPKTHDSKPAANKRAANRFVPTLPVSAQAFSSVHRDAHAGTLRWQLYKEVSGNGR